MTRERAIRDRATWQAEDRAERDPSLELFMFWDPPTYGGADWLFAARSIEQARAMFRRARARRVPSRTRRSGA